MTNSADPTDNVPQMLLELLVDTLEDDATFTAMTFKLIEGANIKNGRATIGVDGVEYSIVITPANATSKAEAATPECPAGFTDRQVREMTGPNYPRFLKWMRGQTTVQCSHEEYNHELKSYQPTGCQHPVGMTVYYPRDVARFLQNPNADVLD